MGEPVSISVVIPTLNAGRAFGTVLHRLMGQGLQPSEILCLDGGSTDGTRHIVSQFPLARFVEGQLPAGPAAWNSAMAEARGEVVAFLAQDALPASGDWLSRLAEPFTEGNVAGVYGRQQTPVDGDPLHAFRLARRFCQEPHHRRLRVGDAIRHKSLPFFLENAAIRRSVWRGIHFNEHLATGADRVWARQAVLASFTIAYAPDAAVIRTVASTVKDAYRLALLTGYTDARLADAGGTLWPDSRRFSRRAGWYLFKNLAWGRLPALLLQSAVERYAYRLGGRLDQLPLSVRRGLAPGVVEHPERREHEDLAA